jgi:hypothetical protein
MSIHRLAFVVTAGVFCLNLAAHAHDPQSVADVARQTRQQKLQPDSPPQADSASNPDASATEPKTTPSVKSSRVITNDDIPESKRPDAPASPQPRSLSHPLPATEIKRSAEYWKSQILPLKNSIAAQQRNIDRLSKSIYFAGGDYEIHEVWNERQRRKLEQLEIMKSRLQDLQDRLDQLQEAARRQGYGNSVYDP